MGLLDRLTGQTFKNNVQAAARDGISQQEFASLKREFDGLNNLAKYAVSSWIAGTYPGLEGALRMRGPASEGWNAYKAADGHVRE
jgi:hypothetical protein